jgi:hypothetical protein
MNKYSVLEIHYSNSFLRVEDHKGYESRHPSMIKLLHKAWEKHVKNNSSESIKYFSLYTDDIFNPNCDYSFAIQGPEFLKRCMPNFIFEGWPECGINDYQQTFDSLVASGFHEPSDDRAFWIGAISHLTDPRPRLLGAQVASEHPQIFDFKIIDWSNRGLDQTKHTKGYVSLQDHCRYRVLIDFGGAGFSARIPLLLATSRPVILVGHPQESWFYWDGSLVPWKHYVPCGSKNGDLLSADHIKDAIQWTFENREQAKLIGAEGQNYAKQKLNRDSIIDLIGNIMLNHKENKI